VSRLGHGARVLGSSRTCLLSNDSRNCIAHSYECDYATTNRNGSRTSRSQGLNSGTDNNVASVDNNVASMDSGVVAPVPVAASTQALTPGVSFYALPITQHRLLYHMSSISMSIEACHSSNTVIYMKRLPM
jgi:hypothetical protein